MPLSDVRLGAGPDNPFTLEIDLSISPIKMSASPSTCDTESRWATSFSIIARCWVASATALSARARSRGEVHATGRATTARIQKRLCINSRGGCVEEDAGNVALQHP